MKTSSITATFLALTGAAIAAPSESNIERDLKAFQLTKLTASLYDQSLPAYRIVNFDLNDPNNNVDTSCSSAWYVGSFSLPVPNYYIARRDYSFQHKLEY